MQSSLKSLERTVVLEMATTLLLMAYGVPILFGLLLILPGTEGMFTALSERFPSLKTRRSRIFAGLNLTLLAGLAVSIQTQWIYAKVSEGSKFCASETIFSCDDVIGNSAYNTVPYLPSLSWGMVGFVTFTVLLFLAYASSKEPNAPWVKRFIDIGSLITFSGLGVIGLLVSYELEMEKICQFCTMAHLANIVALAGFLQLRFMHGEKHWND